jgi:putative Ca2+/H+ antiporter (TMEM165/GDT1 family)
MGLLTVMDWTLSLPLIASTFGVIFIAELPDKTALAALILATRFRVRDVVAGAWAAFAVQTLVGVAAGSVLTLLPVMPIRVASGLGFLLFAFLSLRRQEEKCETEEKSAVANSKADRPAWLASFLVIFAAEWGDLTQLATAALVAQNRHPLSVGIGAILALWTVTLLAVFSGNKLGKLLKPKLLNMISGLLFAAIGLAIIYSALT